MKQRSGCCAVLLFTSMITTVFSDTHTTDANPMSVQNLYQTHCQSCHGINRMGGMGPALLPENLSRLKVKQAESVIQLGRNATQMPAFAEILSADEIKALTNFIYQPSSQTIVWTKQDILNSHIQVTSVDKLNDQPLFKADLMNLFIVVELGDHHATILDGDTFTPIYRWGTRTALHGGPKYSPDGRFVYFASRDGWITKFDIYNLTVVAEVRAGINTRNLAISSDGKVIAVANYLPHNLVMLDTQTLHPFQIIETGQQMETSSRISAVYNAPSRNSFIAALKDSKVIWEIPYSGQPVRKIATSDYLDDFFFDPDYHYIIGTSREKSDGIVVNLDNGKEVATIPLSGMPHLGSGITWDIDGKQILATPNIRSGIVSVIDTETWKPIKDISTSGPGFFMRSHENSRYAWVDVFFGPNKDLVHVIDKATLNVVKTLQPAPGKTAAHVEFTKDGKYALVSIWDNDGAIVVYDANTLKEVKRIAMNKPSGKYNIYNKISYSRGTSH